MKNAKSQKCIQKGDAEIIALCEKALLAAQKDLPDPPSKYRNNYSRHRSVHVFDEVPQQQRQPTKFENMVMQNCFLPQRMNPSLSSKAGPQTAQVSSRPHLHGLQLNVEGLEPELRTYRNAEETERSKFGLKSASVAVNSTVAKTIGSNTRVGKNNRNLRNQRNAVNYKSQVQLEPIQNHFEKKLVSIKSNLDGLPSHLLNKLSDGKLPATNNFTARTSLNMINRTYKPVNSKSRAGS